MKKGAYTSALTGRAVRGLVRLSYFIASDFLANKSYGGLACDLRIQTRYWPMIKLLDYFLPF